MKEHPSNEAYRIAQDFGARANTLLDDKLRACLLCGSGASGLRLRGNDIDILLVCDQPRSFDMATWDVDTETVKSLFAVAQKIRIRHKIRVDFNVIPTHVFEKLPSEWPKRSIQ